MNAEFQRIARRDKKAFLNEQCKEREENNRTGKIRDLFKKKKNKTGLPMQEVLLQRLVIESIFGIKYSTGKKKSNASTSVIKGCELHSGWKVISSDI